MAAGERLCPGVNWLVKYQGSVPKEYLLVETTEIKPDAREVSRFRGFLDKEPKILWKRNKNRGIIRKREDRNGKDI